MLRRWSVNNSSCHNLQTTMNKMLTFDDKLHLVLIWTLNSSAIAANLLKVTVILTRTPKLMRPYSVFVLNNSIIDMLSARAMCSVRFVTSMIQVAESPTIFLFLGPCTAISVKFCRFCQGLHINLVNQSTIVLLLSSLYRLHVINDLFAFRPPSSQGKLWIICTPFPLLLTIFYYLEERDVSDDTMNSFPIFGSLRVHLFDGLIALISPIVMTLIFIGLFCAPRKLRLEAEHECRKGEFAAALTIAVSCDIRDGSVTAQIQIHGDDLEIALHNDKMQPGEWTAIAFGPNMTDLELYLLDLDDYSRVRAHTGVSTGYVSPQLDEDGIVAMADSSYSNGELNARFFRPVKEDGPRKHSIGTCEMITLTCGPMVGDAVGPHYALPKQISLCFDECK
ncbi:hypothetical protein PRIPAC_80641 [Pristionchus pacificus]|uniref:G protein-coupled receptor n=1 Tax=Pristionchus pacificus TaxID=54126 RepID=A0A2A6CP07_PRIPA|nr:hypothetical protein PRIPAC_80641 [Pristionchus pacificus]|eukprot:PDM79932.1 G protein-coupled receptor [Pristionchus pacificus]